MNKKLINVLSTSFLIMGLAAGCGVANNEAGNDRDRNNLTPVGYDNNTGYAPLNVTDTNDTDTNILDTTPDTNNNDTNTNNDGTDGTNDNDDDYSPDPALNQNEANDGDGEETDTNTDNSNETTDDENGTENNTENNTNDTTDTETDERTETQTPALGGNATKFTDVPENNPYANDIHAARDLGLLNGVGNNKFGLGSNLTREQMASILMKAYRAGYIAANNDNNETETQETNNAGTNNNGTTNNTVNETNNNTAGLG